MKAKTFSIISALFGLLIITVGIMNIARGNDAGFGVFLLLVSLLYFSPVTNAVEKKVGFKIHWIFKLIVAVLFIWVNLAVGAIAEGYYPELLNAGPN